METHKDKAMESVYIVFVCVPVCVFWAGDGRLAFCARCFSSFSITGLSVGASV